MRLRHIVTKYSDHINVPVYMLEEDYRSPEENEKGDKPAPKQEVVNRATALWTISKSDIEDEAYKEFYKHVAHDFEDPLIWSHNRVEGGFKDTTLLLYSCASAF